MDEKEFKEIYGGYDPQRCHFSKAILMGCAGCSRSQRVLIAEREAISCLSLAGHERCGVILSALKEKAVFALGITHASGGLPHGKQVKVECGGLAALARLSGAALPDDVDASLQVLERVPGGLDAIPYGEVVRSISHYMMRKRGRGPRSD